MFKSLKKSLADAPQKTNPAVNPGTQAPPTKGLPVLPNSSIPTTSRPQTANTAIPHGTLLVRVIEARGLVLPAQVVSAVDLKTNTTIPYCVIEFDKNETLVTSKDATNVGDNGRSVSWNSRVHFDVSRESMLVLTVYQKSSEGKNLLVGYAKIQPRFLEQIHDEWFGIQTDEVKNLGEVHLQMSFKNSSKGKPMTMDEFELLKVIGKGSFGKVMQVRKKDTNRIYAMKIIKKQHIVERSEVSHTLAERTVLAKINHPFIVSLKFSFQTPEKLYLALAFVNGGELFHHLQNEGSFSPERSKFYTAELLTALECLHEFNIIYRDLKPENILLDYTGHIALCDFGLCKLNMKEGNKTNTFCGTPEYLAPELLLGQGYTKVVDWWTLGILLFEMLTGLPPFYDENVNEMYKKILTQELKFPETVPPVAQDLLSKLLDRDPNKRLGAEGPEKIKKHPFFSDINWDKLLARKYQPLFRPNVASATDTSNFDSEFTSEVPVDSVAEGSKLSDVVQQQFTGFTYQAGNKLK
ncbi:hypothetical protein HK098_001281 [Nowakowskiella sp. JEL0407]|nr:hypothetical protein HK098_001281 [Nowakowskiella sp. JEL0407]